MRFLKVNFPALTTLLTAILLSVGTSSQAQREQIVKYTVINPQPIKRGQPFTIAVAFTVVSGWYIYAPTGVNAAQGMIETTVTLRPPRRHQPCRPHRTTRAHVQKWPRSV